MDQTEEQRKRALQDAGFAVPAFNYYGNYDKSLPIQEKLPTSSIYDRSLPIQEKLPTSSSINSSTLTPTPTLDYKTPIPSPYYPVGGLDTTVPSLGLTAPESKAQETTDEITGLNSRLVGQSQYRTQLEGQYDIEGKTKTLTDLSARLNALKNEALAIPLQLQQDATGRGITKGGLAPIESAALRTNAIQALSTASLFEAAKGNLTTALGLVDRAVAQKFDPLKEEIAVKKANLDLILNSPEYSVADKNRAQKQKALQEEELRQVKVQEENQKTVQGLALQALQNGAPVVIVDRIMSSPDLNSAFQAAQGYAQKETAQSIQEYNFAVRNGYKGSFSAYQNEDANRKIAIAKAGSTISGLPSNVITQIDKLSAAFDSSPIVKNYNEVQNKKLSVDAILSSGIKGPADLALVYEFMKALDPTSVVRETEYATAAKSGNIFAGAYARFNGYMKEGGGFLPTQVKKDFQTLINSKYNIAAQQYQNLKNETARKINMKSGGADGEDYLTNYEAAVPSVEAPLAKGSLSNRAFVDAALKKSGQAYQSIVDGAPKGQIAVVDNQTGEIGYLPVVEFSQSLYTRL